MKMADVLNWQLEATWKMVEELIEACPQEQWLEGGERYFVPACQIYHLLDCAQCLVGNPPKPAPTPKPFGPHWDGAIDRLPTREQLRGLLKKVRLDAESYLAHLSDEDMMNAQHWSVVKNKTPLEQIVYAIRHNQYHVGVVNAELRRRGLRRMQWR